MEQARSALTANCSAAPSRTGNQAGAEQEPAAGDCLAQLPQDQQQHKSDDHGRSGSKCSAFQQRLTPLLLHPSSSHPAAQPVSPLLHASLQPNPGQPTASQESWLSGAQSTAAEQSACSPQDNMAAASAAQGMLDDMLLASPVPAALAALTRFGAAGLEQQPESWSPKATVASLASLRHSAPALVTSELRSTPSGCSSTLRSRSGPAGMVCSPAAQLGRMLRQSASLGSKQLGSSLTSFQELAAARKLAAAPKVEAAAVSLSTELIPACYSASTTPASTRPNSACPRPGGLLWDW